MATKTEINLKTVVLVILGLAGLVTLYSFYDLKGSSEEITLEPNLVNLVNQSSPEEPDWGDAIMSALNNKDIKQTEDHVEVSGLKIFKREAWDSSQKPLGIILFLHGMKFTSKLWFTIGALEVTAYQGYRAVAVDMPGFGQSDNHVFENPGEKVQFMLKLLQVLGMDNPKPIIVCPSMSGTFVMPLLFQHPEVFKAFVPVAPAVNDYSADQFKNCQVPTCSIVGEKDTSMGTAATQVFSKMMNGEAWTIQGAGHVCYDDAPMLFHNILYDYADEIYEFIL